MPIENRVTQPRQLSEISYEKHFVAFLDVLGFREMVFRNTREDKNRLRTYYNLTNYLRETWRKIEEKQDIRSLVISDSVILSVPEKIGHAQNLERFRHFCIAIANLQFHLAMNGVWLRGGISYGDVCFVPEENLLLGPAYIHAYEMERRKAKFPRVVVDERILSAVGFSGSDDLVKALNRENNFYNWKGDVLFDWQKRKVKRSMPRDVSLFLDYLQFGFVKWGDFGDKLSAVTDQLEKNVGHEEKIQKKYDWVVKYFTVKCGAPLPSDVNSSKISKRLNRLSHGIAGM